MRGRRNEQVFPEQREERVLATSSPVVCWLKEVILVGRNYGIVTVDVIFELKYF
jgi:hypothetical protein